ncbi:amino acid ABC transporter permease [Leucobacter insecticola]|uniref:Amino acid ABC transporter permease n=1 Tax=Leucobacter insecticola TaxID=2714934 RepID=A0A6G8FII0_9MICO|nr:amino acid ABC transporter permease [Leucobacter insecticola]QIM16177.1 amino acid ABC transporter permease [Leucobacter insecticola]
MTSHTLTHPILDDTDYTIANKKHPWRWVSGAIILFAFGMLAYSAATNPRFRWDIIGLYFRDTSIAQGIQITLLLTVVCMLLGIVLGIILAVMRLSVNPIVRGAAGFYVFAFRGTPVLVQLLLWYNLAALYPDITFGLPGVHLNANQIVTPLMAAILGLGLNEAAYMSEIVRAGILSVDPGQSEAAGALGLNRLQTMIKVVLPQAMRVIIPPTGNETIGMLKNTSLVSVLAVSELLYSTQVIYAKNFQVIPLLLVASIWYIIMTTVFTVGQSWLEKRFSRGSTRNVQVSWIDRIRKAMRTHDPVATGKVSSP